MEIAKTRLPVLLAIPFVLLLGTAGSSKADVDPGTCPGDCMSDCSSPTCNAIICRCPNAPTCIIHESPECNGTAVGSPINVGALVTIGADEASFKDDFVPTIENGTGWTITVSTGVTDFDVSVSAENVAWHGWFTEWLDASGLCWSSSSSTSTIVIQTCP